MSRCLDTFSTTQKWPKSWEKIEEPVVPLDRNLYGHPLARLLWKRQFEQALSERGWEKIPNWERMFVHRKQGLFLSVYVDDMRIAGKKQNLAPMWKTLMKKRRYWRTYIISWPRVFGMHSAGMRTKWGHHWTVQNVRITYFCMSNREITGMAKNSRTNRSVVLRHGSTCSKIRWAILRMAHKKVEQLQTISSSRKNLNQSENCQKFAHKLSWNDCTWHELDDLTSWCPWTNWQDQSHNGLKHVINDKQSWIRIFITQMTIVNIVMWGTRHSTADLGYFKNQTLRATLRIQSQPQEVSCAFLEAEHLFQSVGVCMKQTSVSHRSTESEIISLDAGLRMDGLPALDLWDICYQGDTYNQGQHSTWSQKLRETWVCSTQLDDSRTKTKRVNRKQGVDQLNELHCVPTNTRSSQGESQLYISEDNEAVIKIVIKGRSPTLRHVSRTHSVALDWLFDRINLDPKIQIKYVDTQNQLADILTKRSFSRNEWNHLLCLFNIMCFSTSSCSHSKSSFPRVMGLWWQKPDLPVWCCKASGKRAPDHMDRDLKNESTQKREEQHSRWPWEGVQNSVWLYGGNPGVYETEQNLCNPKFMMVSLLGKDSLPWHIIVWCISLSQCHKWWKFRMQKLPWTRNEKSSKQFQHGIWEKSRAKTEVVLEAQRDNIRVHFASLMDIRHLKNAEVELKLKK